MSTVHPTRTLRMSAGLAALGAAVLLVPAAFGGTAQAKTKCKSGLTNIHEDSYVVAKVVTDWCYNGKSITSRQSNPSSRVRTAAGFEGLQPEMSEWVYTGCSSGHGHQNWSCLTQRQFSWRYSWQKFGPSLGVCIQTRIFANGKHRRRITTNC